MSFQDFFHILFAQNTTIPLTNSLDYSFPQGNLTSFKSFQSIYMNIDNQELETFLIQAELINQKVKALAENKISTEQFDKYAAMRAEDKHRREEAKKRKEDQVIQAKLNGRDGKGITKDFSHFCRHCHKEYELPTPTCRKCNRPTMTLEQRQNQLEVMVEDYKYNKKTRGQKRHKWEMFQKTQAALWKKSSIDYNKKWEYFVEDSEEEPEKQPIVPKDDPNFRALQMDIEERKKRRAKDTEKAKNLKEKGNNEIKTGNYEKAIEYYTLALQHIKDIKSIYTNRALAYIKLRKFKRAIKDCTNVIEFMEVFEKIGQNKDLAFKAFSRRALARKELKDYKEALNDVTQALKLIPGDKNTTQLKKEIEGFIKHTETVDKLIKQSKEKEQAEQEKKNEEMKEESEQENEDKSNQIESQIVQEIAENELKQEEIKKEAERKQKESKPKEEQKEQSPVKEIPKRLAQLNEQNVDYLFKLLIKNQQLKSIFIAAKGIEALLQRIFRQESGKQQALLICFCYDNSGVTERRVYEWGVGKFYDIIQKKFQNESRLNQSTYDFIDHLFEILVPLTLYGPCRSELAKWGRTVQFVNRMFPVLISKYKKQTGLVDNFFVLLSNLCEGDSPLKGTLIKKEQLIVMIEALFVRIFDQGKTHNRRVLELRQTVFNLISNIITNLQNRKAFVAYLINQDRLSFLMQQLQAYPRFAHNFDAYIQSLLSVLANATLETELQAPELANTIFQRFITQWESFNGTIVYRALLVLGRLKYDSNKNITKWMGAFNKYAAKNDPLVNKEEKNMVQIVKILNVLFAYQAPQAPSQIPDALFKSLGRFVQSNLEHENLFCNTCNLFGMLVNEKTAIKEQVLGVLRESIGQLVFMAKERTGNWRKSAAILMAKASGDPLVRAQMDKHHAMDVLKSIAQFVTDKK